MVRPLLRITFAALVLLVAADPTRCCEWSDAAPGGR